MTRLANAFMEKYPLVTFEIFEGNTYETIEKLKNGMIECAVIRTPFNPDGLTCIYGRQESLMAVGQQHFFQGIPEMAQTNDHPSGKSGILPEQLLGKPLIYYRRLMPLLPRPFKTKACGPKFYVKTMTPAHPFSGPWPDWALHLFRKISVIWPDFIRSKPGQPHPKTVPAISMVKLYIIKTLYAVPSYVMK